MIPILQTVRRYITVATLAVLLVPVVVHAATPGVSVFGGIHASDHIGRIDYDSLNSLNTIMNQRNIPMMLYGGAPQYYINTPPDQLFKSMGNFLQESSTPSNMVWWAGHGTLNAPGGWDNTYVGRQDFFRNTRQIADSLGKDVIITDLSCGSGACVLPEVSQYLGGHLKGVITISGAGQLGYTGQLEQMLSNAGGFASGVDINGDGAISMGELKTFSDHQGWPFKFAGDMHHKLFYAKDASPEKNPELAENVCEVLPPALDGPGVTDDLAEQMSLAGYNETVEEQMAKYPSSAGKKVYFFVPDATNIRRFLGGLGSGNASYEINSLPISPGSYGVGKTILLKNSPSSGNGSAYFKPVGDTMCTTEPIEYAAPNPNSLGSGGPLGGGLGGLGGNALLPLLMQSLLGGGFGGGQGGYGNSPYGNPYTQYGQQLDCASQPISPVCGVDGKTYKNSCYLSSQRVQLKSRGACEQPSPTPQATPNAPAVLDQLSTSGIPAILINTIRNAVSSILSSVLSGGASINETIIK